MNDFLVNKNIQRKKERHWKLRNEIYYGIYKELHVKIHKKLQRELFLRATFEYDFELETQLIKHM